MDDLVQFLRARLDDDEQTARAVDDGSAPWDGQWIADGSNALLTRNGHLLAYGHQTTDGRNLPMPLKPGLAEHTARHDPARVLAEIEAKRRLLGTYLSDAANADEQINEEWRAGSTLADDLLCLLALPYADHPHYQETWKP